MAQSGKIHNIMQERIGISIPRISKKWPCAGCCDVKQIQSVLLGNILTTRHGGNGGQQEHSGVRNKLCTCRGMVYIAPDGCVAKDKYSPGVCIDHGSQQEGGRILCADYCTAAKTF